MHRTAFTRTQRTRRTSSTRRHRTRTLKNRLTRYRTPGRGTHGPSGCAGLRASLRDGCDGPWRRRFVHRTRPRLRNNHARRRRLRRARYYRRSSRTSSSHGSLRRSRGSNRRRSRRRWSGWRNHAAHRRRRTWRCRNRRSTGNSRRRRGRGYRSSRLLHHRSNPRGPRRRRNSWSRNHRRSRRRRGSRQRRHSDRFRHDCWRSGRAHRWGRRRFLLLRDSFQHISRPGNVRQINLSLDFFFAAQWARGLRSRRRRLGRAAQVYPHFFRFVLLERTGMGLLLRHPDDRQCVENGFAFNFQLPGEIVDSNLAHPAFLVLRVVLRSSSQPHGVNVLHSHAIKDVRARHDLFSCFGSRTGFRLMLVFFV
jgi:hypothetical protein